MRVGVLIFLSVISAAAFAIDLTVGPGDVRIEQKGDGGYHLWIRKKNAIACVLLTETTKDPEKKSDNYAFRSPDYYPVNGDEKRLLNGVFIEPDESLHSLIDSTPEPDAEFGQAFHVFIPYVVRFGYEWSRHGDVFLADGSFVNIRTFAKPFADYSGGFIDNPFTIKVTQAPLPGPREENFMKDTVETFGNIAEKARGDIAYSTGEGDIIPKIATILDNHKGKRIDVVLCLDTTESMKNDIDGLKKDLVPMMRGIIKGYPEFRIGMVLYRDYFEEYVTKAFSFTQDFGEFQKRLESVRVFGGRDIPEAVFEALYSGVSEFDWSAEDRVLILVGDAPPHPIPRGKITEAMVLAEAEKRNVEISVIILPE